MRLRAKPDLKGGAYVQDIPQAIAWRRDGRWPLGVLRSQVPRDQGGTVSAATGVRMTSCTMNETPSAMYQIAKHVCNESMYTLLKTLPFVPSQRQLDPNVDTHKYTVRRNEHAGPSPIDPIPIQRYDDRRCKQHQDKS